MLSKTRESYLYFRLGNNFTVVKFEKSNNNNN